jgi:hypothetical protein
MWAFSRNSDAGAIALEDSIRAGPIRKVKRYFLSVNVLCQIKINRGSTIFFFLNRLKLLSSNLTGRVFPFSDRPTTVLTIILTIISIGR